RALRAAIALAFALAGAVVLGAAGVPSDGATVLVFVGVVAAAELLTLDLPDRRGVTVAALPVLAAAGLAGQTTALWAAALGAFAASALRARPIGQTAFQLGRAARAPGPAAPLGEQPF